jgi:D-alanine transaminase
MPELAFLNGKIGPISETFVPVDDRGYTFGDAAYEFIASYNGKLFCLEEHLERLEHSMAMLSFPPLDRAALHRQVQDLFDSAGIARAGIYIQVSRGVAPRDHAYAKDMQVQVLITVRKIKEIPAEIRDKGIDIVTVNDDRWANCHIKTVQILANAMAKQRAKDAGMFDAVFVSSDGVVREGTSANFFMLKQGKLLTHPLTNHILPGITRKIVMELAAEMQIETEETLFSREDAYKTEEAFLTGTVTEVLGIVSIDKYKIGTGRVGDMTKKLLQALRVKAGRSGGAPCYMYKTGPAGCG